MKFEPYPFQQIAIDDALNFLRSSGRGAKKFYTAPTGCGKSIMELCIQKALEDCWIVSPREEIIDGMLDKLEVPGQDMLAHKICTPIRLRNMLMKGEIRHPKAMIYDEGHHHNAESWMQLDLLTGCCASVAFSATGYRGTPRGTKELREHWGDPVPIITFQEAAEMGYISVPEFTMLPLVDDDIVDVRGGEFDVTSIDAATVDRLGDMAEQARPWYNGKWDKPTIFAMPSSSCCIRLQAELAKRGMPSIVVSAATPKDARVMAFLSTRKCITALLHINIVSEGVDLPLRRLVDMAPTMSPVKWVQQLGRITRPSEEKPTYVCTNRNIMRHAYALEGAVPVSAVINAEKAFPTTERAHSRALGLEAIGRFKPTSIKSVQGTTIYMYCLSAIAGDGVVVEYTVLVPPTTDPIWSVKVRTKKEDGTMDWGHWAPCAAPDSVQGFNSIGPKALSEKQFNWWKRSASRVGLDPEQEVTRKNFVALPVLTDLGLRVS